MTKKLEEFFNLPDQPSVDVEEAKHFVEENKEIIQQVDTAIDKIDAALPMVKDLDTADGELDELANLAKDKFEDLMDLGMNVDSRFSGQIFQTAGVLLGHAISAKTAKMDKKLKMIQLQLSKERLDHQKNKDAGAMDTPIEGQGVVLDRNELLQQILASSKKTPNT